MTAPLPLALVAALALTAAAPVRAGDAPGYTVTTVGGMVHGPGQMPATPITDGVFTHVTLDPGLAGEVAFFNNGVDEPNIPGELVIFGAFRGGLLSNGVPFNEHLHGGVVSIGQGALQMLAVVASDGPNRGGETYRVDERLDWRLRTDMALDAGYPQALVVSRDINITSGVLRVPVSLQTEAGDSGGSDRADRLPSGAPYVGRLGDADDDGLLDGRIVGTNRVPLAFLFVPGAPIVMSREIVTDIPLAPRASGLLELASVANLGVMLSDPPAGTPDPAAVSAYIAEQLPDWAADFTARAERAAARLARIEAPEAALARATATALAAARPLAGDPARYAAALAEPLALLESRLPALRAAFAEATGTAVP